MRRDLKTIQEILYRLITAPSGVAEGLADERALGCDGLRGVISEGARLSAEDRVDIYASAYFYRIFDVLKEDYPATLKVLGETDFHNLITGYLIEYPPTHFSITYAGQFLARYVETHPLTERYPYIADLARLERALIDSFIAPDAEPLSSETMRSIDPDAWGSLRMRTHPSVLLLQASWDVAPVLRSLEEGRTLPDDPASGRFPIVIRRTNNRSFYRNAEWAEFEALSLARQGTSFGEICELVDAKTSGESAATIASLLARWLADAMLVASD